MIPGRRLPKLVALVSLLALAPILGPPGAGASEGQRVEIDRREVRAGESVIVSMYGFTGSAITVAVCGNLAKRGSSDCHMTSSATEGVDRAREVTLEQLVVQAPPANCPCVIRAASTSNDQYAVVPFVLVGHPVGPVVGHADQPLLEVSVEARRSPAAFIDRIRSALGGPTNFAVTVAMRNRSTEPLSSVEVSGAARSRLRDDAVSISLPRPGVIEPGQTWVHEAQARIPAPVLGRFAWEVTASGAGPLVRAEESTTEVSVGLLLLAVALTADVTVILLRRAMRRRHVPASESKERSSDGSRRRRGSRGLPRLREFTEDDNAASTAGPRRGPAADRAWAGIRRRTLTNRRQAPAPVTKMADDFLDLVGGSGRSQTTSSESYCDPAAATSWVALPTPSRLA